MSVSPPSYAYVISLSVGLPHARPQITPSLNPTKYRLQPQRIIRDHSMAEAPPSRPLFPLSSILDNTTKYCHQPQRIARDRSMAEKMAEAPTQSPVFKVSNNPKPRAKKEDVASLNDANKGGGDKGISFRPDQPNLCLATKEQLMAVLKKITDEEQDAEEEVVGDDGYDKVSDDGENELHGGGVSSGSCAWSSSRIRHQTKFYADYGNENDNDSSDNDSSDEGKSNDGEEDNLDDPTCDELNNDGNDEYTMDNDNDATDDDDTDDRDGRLCALKAKMYKEKLRRQRENSPRVYWKSMHICLGSNLHIKQAIDMKESAMVLINEWRSMQPKPTREWVIVELERLGVRKLLNGHSASLSDELKARKEVPEVSILYCLLFCLYIHSSLILVTSSGQKSISDCKWRNVLRPPSKRWYRCRNNQACTPPSPDSVSLSERQPKQGD